MSFWTFTKLFPIRNVTKQRWKFVLREQSSEKECTLAECTMTSWQPVFSAVSMFYDKLSTNWKYTRRSSIDIRLEPKIKMQYCIIAPLNQKVAHKHCSWLKRLHSTSELSLAHLKHCLWNSVLNWIHCGINVHTNYSWTIYNKRSTQQLASRLITHICYVLMHFT